MSVQWDTLLGSTGLSNGQTDTEDGVGTKLGLVGRAIELVQELVDLGLVLDVDVLLDESWSNDGVDVLDGLGDAYALLAVPLIGIMGGRGRGEGASHTLSKPLGLVSVTELASLVLTCRSR